jgi:transposase
MFLDFWCYQTMRSRIEPMKKIARTLRSHRPLLLNYFKARKQFSSGVIEGLNIADQGALLCHPLPN